MKLLRIVLTIFILSLLMSLMAAPGAALSGGTWTYETTADNLNNDFDEVPDYDMGEYVYYYYEEAPVEFYIDLPDPLPSFASATLTITAEDVDADFVGSELDPEVDIVYLNGHQLGQLDGADEMVVDTVFTLDPAWLIPGHNIVVVDIDVYHDDWGASIWGGEIALSGVTVGECTRADVAVVIYGGWDGIPVKAYVGGTEQKTMYTAHDALGEAAVLWTFYPSAGGWNVSVVPQTPAGKDPARWQYKLVRIVSRWPKSTNNSPTSASATIYPCSERVFYFQLVDTGAK